MKNNKLIAEFMGLSTIENFILDNSILQEKDIKLNQYYYDTVSKIVFKCEKTAFPLVIVQKNNYHCANINNCKEVISELKYHSDWNELMAVISKIADETEYELVSGYDYSYWNKYGENPFEDAEEGFGGYYKIENIYKAVVEFIKWYNNKTK
jgi:hypothetical protein